MAENANLAINHPGMGAIPGGKGVTFRVWAPHAEKVYVTGTFNDWSKTSTPLAREENGYWSTDVSEAKAGDEYRYVIHGPKAPISRIDPYARKVTSSIGNGVIYDPQAFDWGDDNFHMATGNELVMYEMHVGTFHVKEAGRPGTFDSAMEKLPYLQELGINAVEVMPVAEFPGDFSWGYNPSHPFAVASIYGGPDTMKQFVKAAHEHGIELIASKPVSAHILRRFEAARLHAIPENMVTIFDQDKSLKHNLFMPILATSSLLSSSMSFTTTLAPLILIYGSLTGGAKMRKGEFTLNS